MVKHEEEEFVTPIEEYIKKGTRLRVGDAISNCFISIDDYKTSFYGGAYSASYFVSLYDINKEVLNRPFKLSPEGLEDLFLIIQTNKLNRFSEVGLLLLEEIARYNKGADIHYYLKVILEEPGEVPSIPKVKKKIPCCKECKTMLLRYGYQWKIQRNDLQAIDCPYCGKPLESENRDRKLIQVILDYSEENCSVGDTRAQIGILYHNQQIKSTINAKGIFHYLQNYQHHFENNAIGPITLEVKNGRPYYIKDLKPGVMRIPLEWRPVMLFPEDMMAL